MLWTTVAVAFLLAFAEFDAKFIKHVRQLNIISTTSGTTQSANPPCEKCVFPKPEESGNLKKAIQDLRPVLKNIGKLHSSVFQNILTSVNNTQFALQSCVSAEIMDIVPVLDELSKAASNINNCPPLKALCTTLQTNVIAFVDSSYKMWPKILTERNLLSMQHSLLESISDMRIQIITVYRDIAYNLLQIFAPELLCNTLGKAIYNILDPSGDLALRIAELFRNSSQSEMQTLLQTIFKGASGGASGSINIFDVSSRALCILESGLHIDNIVDNDCANPLAAAKDLACSTANLLLTFPGLSSISGIPLPSLKGLCPSIL